MKKAGVIILHHHQNEETAMKYGGALFCLLISFLSLSAQPEWKLAKDKNGIKVYLGQTENSKFKSIRVQCTLAGTIAKLQNILRDVSHHPGWVYKAKKASLVKVFTRNDFIYYSETEMPWPVTNRDGIYHLTMNHDSVHHTLSVQTTAESNGTTKKDGLIRIPYSKALWKVIESDKKISIDFTFEVDPGGGLPAWLVNLFADKGPYDTFKKLEDLLSQ